MGEGAASGCAAGVSGEECGEYVVTPFWVLASGSPAGEAGVEDNRACGVKTSPPLLELEVDSPVVRDEDPPCGE
jgi:hypothetical protein